MKNISEEEYLNRQATFNYRYAMVFNDLKKNGRKSKYAKKHINYKFAIYLDEKAVENDLSEILMELNKYQSAQEVLTHKAEYFTLPAYYRIEHLIPKHQDKMLTSVNN